MIFDYIKQNRPKRKSRCPESRVEGSRPKAITDFQRIGDRMKNDFLQFIRLSPGVDARLPRDRTRRLLFRGGEGSRPRLLECGRDGEPRLHLGFQQPARAHVIDFVDVGMPNRYFDTTPPAPTMASPVGRVPEPILAGPRMGLTLR